MNLEEIKQEISLNRLISNKELAKMVHKTPSAISYIKKKNPDEFLLTKLGGLCVKLGLTADDIVTIAKIKNKIKE